MPSSFLIRPATPSDAATLADFNARLAREAEHKELDPAILRAGVEGALARPEAAQYFVAETTDGPPQIIGQLMLTYEWSDWRNGNFWWIQSVYVHPDHRRRGVFKSLYKHVEALARSSPHTCGLRLYVDCDNHHAIATYFKLGMRPAGYTLYEHDWSNAVTPSSTGNPSRQG